jgi:putative oxidoreductase
MRAIYDLLGRILLSCIFIFEAYDSIAFMGKTKLAMTKYGLTDNQDVLLYGAIFLLVMGGLMLLLGYRSTLGSVMLIAYWAPVTFLVHDFWNSPHDEVRIESVLFMKNIAIIGGLLMVMANGSGKYSIKKLFATTKVNY